MSRIVTLSIILAIAGCQTSPSSSEHSPIESGAEAPTNEPSDPTEEPMKDLPKARIELAVAAADALAATTASPLSSLELRDCVDGINTMAIALWRTLDKERNTALSPASISLAMSMVLAGAKGETAVELSRALALADDETTHRCWSTMISRWRSFDAAQGIEFHLANRLFGERSVPFEAAYLAHTLGYYDAPLALTDLRDQPEISRQGINRWVEEHTKDRIKDLLPPRSIDGDTTLVLVNAIYMLANWKYAFDKGRTRQESFIRRDGTSVIVNMMTHREPRFAYADVTKAQILELPYTDGDLSMIVLLPPDHESLATLEASLDPKTLKQWLDQLKHTEVHVFLPQFTLEPDTINLVDSFQKLGVQLLFQAGVADLTDIYAPENVEDQLHIDGIYHKTFIKVDETGTEAAAATAVVASRGGAAPPKVPQFLADRPFIFLIWDRRTDAILFIGRVADPRR